MYARAGVCYIYTAKVQLFSECRKFFMLNSVSKMLRIINTIHHILTVLCTNFCLALLLCIFEHLLYTV